MNKINFFYASNGNMVPTPTLLIPNNHIDNLNISTMSCFVLEDKPFKYYYEIDVNNFPSVTRSPLPPFENYNIMGQSIINMTSNFRFKDVYSNTQYIFEIRLFDSYGNQVDKSTTTVFLIGGGK
ncbi:hypothetical protein [Pseudolactococcus carnosus]|uniref:hypothetical protein n=1 Tax=Pseudolactococcus carnosus TaxID=2749961 RepID=UPI001FBAC635|nr:hypothetical protein [Lactococcus carnosus]MCJ2003306.1 hypothetical protein [Lactococcus carnosus]